MKCLLKKIFFLSLILCSSINIHACDGGVAGGGAGAAAGGGVGAAGEEVFMTPEQQEAFERICELLGEKIHNNTGVDPSAEINGLIRLHRLTPEMLGQNTGILRFPQTPLMMAIICRSIKLVEVFVSAGVSLNQKVSWRAELNHFCLGGKYSISALHVAASMPNLEILQYLIKQGADINIKDNEERTPLDYAAGFPRLENLNFLLGVHREKDPDFIPAPSILYYALYACDTGIYPFDPHRNPDERRQCFQRLVHAGVNVNGTISMEKGFNKLRVTIVHDLAEGNYNDLLEWVLNQPQVDLHWRDGFGKTALRNAQERLVRLQESLDLRRAEPGVDPDNIVRLQAEITSTQHVITLLQNAEIKRPRPAAVGDFVRGLVDEAEILKVLNRLLCDAACSGEIDKLREVLASELHPPKSYINILSDYHDRTALFWAVFNGDWDCFDMLLAAGADPNIKMPASSDGKTMVHFLVRYREGFDRLCKNQHIFDLNITDKYGDTPWHHFARISTGRRVNWTNISTIVGINFNASNELGDTPVHIAARYGFYTFLEKIAEIEPGKTNFALRNKKQETALHCAAGSRYYDTSPGHDTKPSTYNRAECILILLKNGVDVDAQDDEGNTALHVAVRDNHVDCMEALFIGGCNSDIRNNAGQTPLEDAPAFSRARAWLEGVNRRYSYLRRAWMGAVAKP